MVSRRLVVAVMMAVLLWQTPALASLVITDRQQAATELTTGPQFFEYGSGELAVVGTATDWEGVELDGVLIDPDTGHLVLGRAGDVAPTDDPWHDAASASRACEATPGSGIRSLRFDIAGEIAAERLRADLADIRAYEQVGGAPVSFRADAPMTSESGELAGGAVIVDVDAAVCVYWGDPNASSASDPSIQGPVVPDGGWSWSVWNDVGDGSSLDLVDWTTPSFTADIPTASVPNDVCNQCANEIVGFLTPSVTGSYRLYLSADDVGRLELAPAQPVPPAEEDPPVEEDPPAEEDSPVEEDPPAGEDPPVEEDPPAEEDPPTGEDPPAPLIFDPAAFSVVLELGAATPIDDFSAPAQASEPVQLVAGQAYALRARSKDLEDGDHLQIAWALDGEEPSVLPSDAIVDIDGVAGSLTHRRFDVVETAVRSGPPDSTVRIEASQNDFETCDECAHSISGYVVVEDAGTYRFWISSDDEGALLLSTTGDPSAASRVAWLTNFTDVSNWTADPSQGSAPVDLAAGQTIWLGAYNRDRGGPDHLQVGWSRVDTDPVGQPAQIPASQLSQSPPAEAPLPTAELGPIQGQAAASGTFETDAVDTTTTGSNVFGLLIADIAGGDTSGAAMTIEFADAPDGPWVEASPLVDGDPAPLSADGLRYVRVVGSITSPDISIATVGVERDISEATSVDATTTVSVPGAGDYAVLRVRGSIGSPAVAELASSSTAGAQFWLDGAGDPARRDLAPLGPEAHHVGVTVDVGVGPTSATTRWTAVDGVGVVVVHDIVLVVEGA